ncbi:acetylxylan esterase [Kaistia dalseonensis]|uniref:Cephalosporin-C deacetylase n=1 Tax=Kaistia dalseonensis TaxID=410840 RepID=A0ABU0H285_9HYPH|nr:acetylxylan esterase [Kaistia dalseonensis]MCX5493853.1 acetylxylan esterase [Kaistia dalseonensis]MDQ0436418.1 cephalosporin-C deacetylase [Kaistia dalseonensis]
MSIPTEYPFDFDPTYGFGVEELLAIRPPEGPPGFDDFWRTRYVAGRSLDPQPKLSASQSSHPDWETYDISYRSTDDFAIGGWLLLPRNGTIKRGLVVGHGYGGRDTPDFSIPVAETAVLFPCFRGLSRSQRPPIPSEAAGHVLYDIDKLDRYILGGCVEDLWLAVSVLTELYPEIDGRIGYSGASFGGGIGALAIPYDARIDRGNLVVPTFGNVPLWLSLPTLGSGHSVQAYLKTHPGVIETLRFFDAATAARRIRIPMLMAVAQFDPAVAPPCQFSIANALPTSTHHETVILDAGHFEYPGSEEQQAFLTERVRQFFGVT